MEMLAESTAKALIHAPIGHINLTEWLFTLKSDEYRSCSKSHLAAGSSFTPDGKRMSLNVEKVADTLLIQHYVEDISEKQLCRVQSVSDSFSAMGNTTLGVVWEVSVKAVSDRSCELSNRVVILQTEQFAQMLVAVNATDLASVKMRMGRNVALHNAEETPLFAKDIEAKALNGVWL
ncbi:hypothetical protein [Flavobacterium sp.]|uniref:hypothetical protein n=1 Tax=Flavobacterium sp. TaxID=239 RepID=UPI0039E3CFC9